MPNKKEIKAPSDTQLFNLSIYLTDISSYEELKGYRCSYLYELMRNDPLYFNKYLDEVDMQAEAFTSENFRKG
jgi:hypothetical protein